MTETERNTDELSRIQQTEMRWKGERDTASALAENAGTKTRYKIRSDFVDWARGADKLVIECDNKLCCVYRK